MNLNQQIPWVDALLNSPLIYFTLYLAGWVSYDYIKSIIRKLTNKEDSE